MDSQQLRAELGFKLRVSAHSHCVIQLIQIWGEIIVCERVETVCRIKHFSLVTLRELIISCLSPTVEYKFMIICDYRIQANES